MKRKLLLTLTAAAVVGAIAIPAIAGGWGSQQMMQRMHGAEAGAMQGRKGAGPMMRGTGGPKAGRMGGMSDNPVYRSFDTDGDGTVSPAELEAGLAGLLATHDADGNGALSAEEFEALFVEVMRGMAERPFAMLDADGDGQITADEMAFPVQMMMRKQAWQDRAPRTGRTRE